MCDKVYLGLVATSHSSLVISQSSLADEISREGLMTPELLLEHQVLGR